MKKIPASLGLLLSCVLAMPAYSATPTSPGAVLEGARETREYLERQRRLREAAPRPEAEIVDETDAAAPPAKAGETRFVLQQVRFSASQVLSAGELTAIAGRYVGREVRVADLFALVAEVNALYRERKVIAAKAVLPPQKIEQGSVEVRLVEGQVGAVSLIGNDSTQDGFVLNRLDALQPGSLVYLDTLESELFYFNAVNDIDLRAVLKPGASFGTTDYVLQVTEPPRYDNTVFIDNAGREDVGLYRLGFTHINRSVLGYRDDLSIGGHIAEGTKAIFAAYNFPVNSLGTRMGLSADYSEIDIVAGALEPLNVTGDSANLGLFLTHPLQVTRSGRTNGFVGFNSKESNTDFDGVTLFSTTVQTVTAGVDIQRDSIGSSWFGRGILTNAPKAWDNDQSFWRVNADVSWIGTLSNNQVLLLRASGQWSPDDLLPSSEQFQVGGMSSVRGYPEGLLIGDRGYFASAEFSFPLSTADAIDPTANPFTQRLRGVLFLDHGAAFPFKGNNAPIDDDDFLTSVGGGLSLNLGRKVQGRLLAGFPLSTRDDGEDGVRLHFYVQSQGF